MATGAKPLTTPRTARRATRNRRDIILTNANSYVAVINHGRSKNEIAECVSSGKFRGAIGAINFRGKLGYELKIKGESV